MVSCQLHVLDALFLGKELRCTLRGGLDVSDKTKSVNILQQGWPTSTHRRATQSASTRPRATLSYWQAHTCQPCAWSCSNWVRQTNSHAVNMLPRTLATLHVTLKSCLNQSLCSRLLHCDRHSSLCTWQINKHTTALLLHTVSNMASTIAAVQGQIFRRHSMLEKNRQAVRDMSLC
jgi:hypothetical protein